MLYGPLYDIFGRKIFYISAFLLLYIAYLYCGLLVNPTMFYVFRGLANVAGGGVLSLLMIIISNIVSLEQREWYQGNLDAALGTGNVTGPFIAAVFVVRSTWCGIFRFISPSAACYGVVAFFLIPNNVLEATFREGWSTSISGAYLLPSLIPFLC